MTPQEKAIELYEKYDSLFKAPFKKHKDTKLCALIAVNELTQECNLQREWYWNRVKTEIEKL